MENSLWNKIAFWQKTQSKVDLGVYLSAGELTVFEPSAQPSHMKIAFEQHDWHSAFSQLTRELSGANLQIVLSADYYQLLVVDRPAVEETEMSQALQWAIKDMVSAPVTELHLDYFETPQSTANKLTVVVVERALLSNMVTVAEQLGITIAGISIEEMAISNLSKDAHQAKLVLCHKPGSELMLTVIKQGQLFMQRSVRGFSQIDSVAAAELSFGVADNLSLELQRSMDYFESQLRQAPVTSIELLMGGAREELAKLLSTNFNQQVNVVECQSVADKLSELAYLEFSLSVQEEAA
ncbi:type II secretion system protein GspL [Shewanella colwelliana]|uniref:type II secretion system protein GspL n=1 Tax=Shewanella colwelliana TaxID=23 RepID=UPI0022AF935C|nr:MSHA biogenesis protein MshI [Shewanella colwelliana]MCZ4337312.1 MSHA biogenesis protein MshI [Shewanella colwelliana]